MKKLLVVLIIFLFALDLYAEEKPREKTPFRMRDRHFEMGFANVDVGFANNFLGIKDILTDKITLDFTGFDKDFILGFDFNLRPFYFNINAKNRWGFGMDIGNITAYGSVAIAGNLLRLKKSDKDGDPFGVGASVFVDVGIPVFFKIKNVRNKDLRINLRPAGFVAAFYASPDMKYTYKDTDSGTLLEIDYGIKAYSPFSLDFENESFNIDISSMLGFDISIGAEYSLSKRIDLGIQFINIPIKSSRLNNYLLFEGKASFDSSEVTIEDLINDSDAMNDLLNLPENYDIIYGSDEGKRFYRPFKMLFTANYRPFAKSVLFISPVIGFSYNPVFVKKASVEFGVKVGCDLGNILKVAVKTCYEDQMWKNGADIMFNLYVLELGFGVAMQSQQFVQSWQGKGLRANLSVKLGF